MSDSKTAVSKWRNESVEGDKLTAKHLRFQGWTEEISFTQDLPIAVEHIAGELNELADLFSRITEHLSSARVKDSTISLAVLTPPVTPLKFQTHHLPLDADGAKQLCSDYAVDQSKLFGESISSLYHWFKTSPEVDQTGTTISAHPNGQLFGTHHPAGGYLILMTRMTHIAHHYSDEPLVTVIPHSHLQISTAQRVFENQTVTLKYDLIFTCHNMRAHPGSGVTLRDLKQLAWWPGMINDVNAHIAKCEFCNDKQKGRKSAGFTVCGSSRFQRIQIDHKVFNTDLATQCGHAGVLTIVDTLTGITHYSPATDFSAKHTALKIFVSWISRYGIPAVIQTDNASSFSNSTLMELSKLLQFRHATTAIYTPSSNGKVESRQKLIGKIINIYSPQINKHNLQFFCALGEYLCNVRGNSSLLCFGEKLRTFPHSANSTDEDIALDDPDWQAQINRLQEIVFDNCQLELANIDERSRVNMFQSLSKLNRNKSRRYSIKLNQQVLYNDNQYEVTDLYYTSDPRLPQTAKIQDHSGTSIIVSYDTLKPLSEQLLAEPPTRLLEFQIDEFVFYKLDSDVLCGKIVAVIDNRVLIHSYNIKQGKKQTKVTPLWWIKNPSNNEWQTKEFPTPPRDDSDPVKHPQVTQLLDQDLILAHGKISLKGILSDHLKSQLHSLHVFHAPTEVVTGGAMS